jgi:hypothetical protein
MSHHLDRARLQAARDRLTARNAEELDPDASIAQFALDLATEVLEDSGVREVLDADDHAALTLTTANAIATGMHAALEATRGHRKRGGALRRFRRNQA